MKEAFIIDGIRTAIGNFGGTLSAVRTDDLGAIVIKELMERNPSEYLTCESTSNPQNKRKRSDDNELQLPAEDPPKKYWC